MISLETESVKKRCGLAFNLLQRLKIKAKDKRIILDALADVPRLCGDRDRILDQIGKN